MATLLAECRYRQGRFLGSLADLGFPALEIPALQTLVDEVVKTSEIEGEILDTARCACRWPAALAHLMAEFQWLTVGSTEW